MAYQQTNLNNQRTDTKSYGEEPIASGLHWCAILPSFATLLKVWAQRPWRVSGGLLFQAPCKINQSFIKVCRAHDQRNQIEQWSGRLPGYCSIKLSCCWGRWLRSVIHGRCYCTVCPQGFFQWCLCLSSMPVCVLIVNRISCSGCNFFNAQQRTDAFHSPCTFNFAWNSQ